MLTPRRQAETPTRESIGAEGCIHHRFERWVAATPDAPAVTCERRTVSYGELDRLAERVARRLRSMGAGPDAIVGLLADRSIDLIVGLLGILKADAAYLPLDPGHPPDRRAWMLADAKVRVVITQERFGEELRQTGMATVIVDGSAVPGPTVDEAPETFSLDAADPAPRVGIAGPDHLAYVIYTSGSTGRPKGVMVTHHNVVRLMTSTEPLFGFGAADVTTLFHSIAFDFSVWELWAALAYGGRLVVVPGATARDPLAFRELLVTEQVTVLNQTPSAFRHLIEADQSAGVGPSTLALRWVIFGGEALPMRMLVPWFERHGDEHPRLVNMYGITETTVHVTWRMLSATDVGRMSLIGEPLSDLEILLLGSDLLPVTDGETGEIHVGGPGLARGYLGRPELTAERFISHPFSSVAGARLYRSGDLARRLSDGELEYRGRADHQVKIRGHRVEPGEIETTLLTHPAVRAAAVLPFRDGDETGLAAFLVRRDGSDEPIDGLRSWLESRLPSAFVPARLVPVGDLPLNANGKLDRSLLLARLDDHDKPTLGEPARPGTESRVALLWRELLRGPAPGRNDDFFALGGHSLTAIRLVAAIDREFRVRLPVTTVFETRTLSRLAEVIDAAVADGEGRTAAEGFTAEQPISLEEEPILPVLPAQRGMWLLDSLLAERATYNQPFAYRPEGPVDWERFRASLRRTMARHPALRSFFGGGDEGPVQRVVPIDSVPVPWSVEPAVDETAIREALLYHARIPFDLATAPLWRATLFPAAAAHGVLLLNFHHAIIDLWSIDLLLQELASPADHEPDGERPPVEASHFRLPGLVPAERDRCARYWRETLADSTGELAWPMRWSLWDGGPTGGIHRFGIDADASAALHRMALETGGTTFQILLAVFHGWLHRVTGADDVVVGTPVSLRSTPEVQASVNCFLNTLPVRVRWNDEGVAGRAFTDLVGHVRETFLAAVSHGVLPFDEIVAVATKARAGERPPIVTTVFVHTDKGLASALLGGVSCEPIPVDTGTAKFDLTLFMEGDGAGLRGAFEYDRRRFDEATIAGFAASFTMFLRSVLSAPTEAVVTAALLDAGGRQRMLHDLADGEESSTSSVGLIEPFREQVEATPDASAVTWCDGHWTYHDLHRHAEQIATRLRRAGAAADTPVAICLPRSPELQAAILGVLMAKACCVPLDPTLPAERLATMLSIAGCPLVVADSRTSTLVETLCTSTPPEASRPQVVRIDADVSAADASPGQPEETMADRGDDHRAYILFTSGSTGVPKGVEMPVGPLANLVAWQCRYSMVRRGARTLQFASAGFDVSFQEMFSTWLSGGDLVIVPEEARLDPAMLLELLIDSAAERIFLPVAVLEHLAEGALATRRFPSSLREVIVAGEQLRIGAAIRGFCARLPACILWNQYGPTESHVVTSQILAGDPTHWPDLPPIGRPIAGASIRVLDAVLEPVPVDVAGEIWIGGDCLARGYVGRADLTAERFIDDPFAAEPGRRMYRSGDIGRWRDDGRLEYLGRVDRQVKIRGHRVEPDEIEAMLSGHPLVAEAAVVVRRDEMGASFLVAHVVPVSRQAIVPSDLVAWMAARLPAAMIPLRIGVHDGLPLTPNGKINRHSLERSPLPELAEVGDDAADERPWDGTEQAIAELWLAVLGRGVPRRHDNFFHAGGTSLSAMRLVARARERLGIHASVRHVFDHPTVAALAAHWLGAAPAPLAEAARSLTVGGAGDDTTVRALPAQRLMWFLQTVRPDRATYNLPHAFRPAAPIDWGRFRAALHRVMARHPALRTSLEAGNDGPVQRIAPVGKVTVPWSVEPAVDETAIGSALRSHARIPFDLATAPLWRATLFPAAAPHGVLLLNFHHAIIDDWSIGLLLDEFAASPADHESDGEQPPVEAPPFQLPSLGQADRDRCTRFWRETLADATGELSWPVRWSVRDGRPTGGMHRFGIDADASAALHRMALETGATTFQILLAAFHGWLHRVTGADDVIVGTPVSLRSTPEVQASVNCFLNTLPVRIRWGDEGVAGRAFTDLVGHVRETFLAAVSHGGLPFDEIVAVATAARAGERPPIVTTVFVHTEKGLAAAWLDGVRCEPIPVETGTAKFDLTLFMEGDGAGLRGAFEYDRRRFDEATIAGFAASFTMFLRSVLSAPAEPLELSPLLSAEERQRVVHDWNDTAIDLGPPATLQERFSEQARQTPHAVALLCEGHEVTYAALDAASDRLAGHLSLSAVAAGRFVGIFLERSIDFVVAVLGILKSGCGYVPLPSDHPAERLAFMIEDAGLTKIVTCRALAGFLPARADDRVLIDADEAFWGREEAPPSVVAADGTMPAYVMYTSGSTGKPKGVVVPHRAVVRLVCGQSYAGFGPELRTLLLAPVAFDASTFELWAPLLSGGTCVVFPDRMPDPERLGKIILKGRVNCLWLTAALFNHVVDTAPEILSPVDHVITGGEALSVGHVRRAFDRLPGIRLTNGYGPTESTTFACTHAIDRGDGFLGDNVPIGRPLANTTCFVVDEAIQPVGVGVPGQLLIGGDGVAIGYLQRPELTEEKFIPDPFSGRPGSRLYRTGDLCRWRGDGNLEFLGRLDDQIKIRGFRVEPGEIEVALEQIEGVRRAVVVCREFAPGDRRLIAYLVVDDDAPDDEALKAELASRLPEAMVPWRFVRVDSLPMNANGKLDRAGLLLPDAASTEDEASLPPRGAVEEALTSIWCELLGISAVGRDDDFFALGGHSLRAMRLMAAIERAFRVRLPVSTVFEARTVSRLAAAIDATVADGASGMAAEGVTADSPIPPTEDRIFPALPAQRGMWLLDALLADRATYNQPFAFRPDGPIDWERFRESLRRVMARHPALRSAFEAGDAGPVQRIAAVDKVAVPWSEEPLVDETAIGSALRAHARIPFDLATAPLWRATLFPAAAPHGVLLLNFHHAIIDDWSIDVCLADLGRVYVSSESSGTEGSSTAFAPMTVPAIAGPLDPVADKTFWAAELTGIPDGVRWPGMIGHAGAVTSRGETHRFRLDGSVADAWRGIARETDATLFAALFAAFHAWVHRVTGSEDTVIATPVAGRAAEGLEEAVGCFINTLPIRVRWGGDPALAQGAADAAIRRVRDTFLTALDHGQLPFDEIVTSVPGRHAGRRYPLTNVMFVFLEPTDPTWTLGPARMEKVDVDTGTSRFDFTLSLVAGADGIEGTVEYSTDVLARADVERLVAGFIALLGAVAADPGVAIRDIDLLSANERRRVVHDFNATSTDLGPPATLQGLFATQVVRSPTAVALAYGDDVLSYSELAGRVNRLARFLRSRGVGPDVPVAVCLERSVEMVVALLGIVTAGGAYLPLDPEYPAARITAMLDSASPPVVLVQKRFHDRVAGAAGEVFSIDTQWPEWEAFDGGPLDDIAMPDDLAYVIYTSGSTGAPKGVMNTHAGIVNRLRWMQDAYGIDAGDRVLQKTPFGFDVSVWEFFWPLLTGARIVMAPPGLHRDPSALADLVEAAGITVIHFVPSMLEVFLEVSDLERSCRSLRHVFASGEALGEGALRHCLRRIPSRLHNLYGPTEAAVDVTYHECRTEDPPGSVPIGRPIANMRTYVLDAERQPVGVGIEGELWLAGVGVARGYLGRPDLTAERFLPDPFVRGSGERMYRTGDLARWRPDGEIEYLGRLDHQVKLRGVRIELGEIEAELERIEGVTRAVVIDREIAPGDRRLLAYLVAEAFAPNDGALKSRLAERLPEAMMPWRFVRVHAIPLNANGKLDRAALPSPDAAIDSVEASPRSSPVGETEEALAAIWCDLLGVSSVGRDDGFFARGGHSLLSMRLVSAIERRFGVRLPVKAVFDTPMLAELAARISRPPAALPESTVALMTIPARAEVIDCRPLPAQRGLWLLHSLLPHPATYNVPIAWRVDGSIDWPRLERSLAAVVARHPALRTALVQVDGELVQRVLPTDSVAVPWRVVTIADESDLQTALEHEASTPFNLAVAPLLRAVRIDIAGTRSVLMIVFHHAIIDEWSIGILRTDLAAAYAADDCIEGGSLPVVTVAGDPTEIERNRRFWREELAAVPVETPLPGKSVAAAVEVSRGSTSRFTVEPDALDRLRGLAGSSGVTLFNVLLASAHAWLQRMTGQRDLVIGTPVATRGAAETAGAVGCLINVLPIRVRFDEGGSADPLTLPGLAERVQEIFLRALDHADFPFDQIVAAAMPTRLGSRQPLVNVLLTVVETGNRSWRIGAATLQPLTIDTGLSRFDLSLTLEIGSDGLEGSLEFAPDRYDANVCDGFASRFAAFLAEVAAGPTVPIDRMAMLSDAVRRRVIEEFNATDVDLGRTTTLHGLLMAQATRTPSACAVSDGGTQVTYDALQQRAARLAARLRGLGIGSGDRVGIALPRSIDAIVAMLAVLRSGAAWVPLDREAPPARLAFIVGDARLAAIIDSGRSAGGWPAGIAVVDLEAPDRGDHGADDFPAVAPDAPAYVMYTSGSTGQPKGVVVPHAAVVNYLRGKQRRFPIDAADVILHATRTTFDISVYEVFGPLLAGASLVILPPGRTDPVRVAELMREARVTVAQFVPSLLALLVDDDSFVSCPSLRRVFCGGEAMPLGVMDRFLARSVAELVNVYGPTEATVWATAWVCRRSECRETPPIGRPLDNVRCYVLDAGRRPVPAGTVGELFIGGDQLAIGYHDRPDLTAERFLPDPFVASPGARMYRTGDACRWRDDGMLEFVARTDQQVKIRGHRIEPAEVEACLAGHPHIAAVAVVVSLGNGPASLVAGVVPRGGGLDADTLRKWTAERLPEVMIPSRFVSLEKLPVNPNGKLDRGALAKQITSSTAATPARPVPPDARPRTVVPVFLLQIRAAWQRVFGRVDFGDDENFFHDLGGQSIMAARLAADLSSVLGRRVPLAAVFEAPTVASMAALLRDEGWMPRFRAIVPLQPLGAGPPLFLFHGIGGGIGETLELARACGPEVPVCGVQAIDRDGGEMQPSVEAMGELYAAEIVAFQPRGPYFLGGFSLGGWFAYETARQLRMRGHDVALLAQFDTHVNCLLPEEVVAAAERTMSKQYAWKHLRRFASHPRHWWRYLRKFPVRLKLARQWRVADPIKTDRHGALVARYRPMPYAGPVDYFQAADSLPAVLGVWQRWCPGGVTVHPVPGDHHEVIFGANAAVVAAVIRGILRDRTAQSGSSVDPVERSDA